MHFSFLLLFLFSSLIKLLISPLSVDISVIIIMAKKSNLARDLERLEKRIEKNVEDAWKKHQNPNHFGGWPVVDAQGKIISISITAYGHVAKLSKKGWKKLSEETILSIQGLKTRNLKLV